EDTGEVVRVRGGSFVIGRVEGDLIIPHDGGISGRHAEILRRIVNGKYAWILRDLGSTNGTFVRASSVALHHDQELLIGDHIVRFIETSPGAISPEPPAPRVEATSKLGGLIRADDGQTSSPPALVVEMTGAEPARYPLTGT